MGNVEGHPEVPGQPQEVGRALSALLGPGLVRVVEVAAVQPHGLDADHHGPAQGIGHGRVQEVIPKGLDNLLDGEADGGGEFRVGRASDDGSRVLAQEVAVAGKVLRLRPQVIHDPELVVAVDEAAKVDRPDLIPVGLTAVQADLFPVGQAGDAQANQGDGLRARLQAVGWVHGATSLVR